MDTELIRREIHKDPVSGNESIYVTGVGDISKLTITDGEEELLSLQKGGTVVRVLGKPEVPLFALKDPKAYGADERLEVKGNSLADGLELLLRAFILRSKELREEGNPNRKQFYPYVTYDMIYSSLTGRLLMSEAIAPAIDTEISNSVLHFRGSNLLDEVKCLYCGVIGVIEDPQTQSLIISDNGYAVSHRSRAPLDPHFIYVAPKKHTSRFTDLTDEQAIAFACLISDSVERIKKGATKTREFDTLHIALHSAPLHYRRTLESIYHFHAEIFPDKKAGKGDYLVIPGSGWNVVLGKPN